MCAPAPTKLAPAPHCGMSAPTSQAACVAHCQPPFSGIDSSLLHACYQGSVAWLHLCCCVGYLHCPCVLVSECGALACAFAAIQSNAMQCCPARWRSRPALPCRGPPPQQLAACAGCLNRWRWRAACISVQRPPGQGLQAHGHTGARLRCRVAPRTCMHMRCACAAEVSAVPFAEDERAERGPSCRHKERSGSARALR